MATKFILYVLIFQLLVVTASSQNVIIKGVVGNYRTNYIPFYLPNYLTAENLNIPVDLSSDNTYSVNFQTNRPRLFSLFYEKIFVEPGDSVEFNFSFVSSDKNNYDDSIYVKTRFPGNYSYYHNLKNWLKHRTILRNTNADSVKLFFDQLKSFFDQQIKDSIVKFQEKQPISNTFQSFLSNEFPFYFLSEFLMQCKYKFVKFSPEIISRITQLINKSPLNDEQLIGSGYYLNFLGDYIEYFYCNNLYPSTTFNFYRANVSNILEKFTGLNKDLGLVAATRLYFLAKPNYFNAGSDSLKNVVIRNISNQDAKSALVNFTDKYTVIDSVQLYNIKLKDIKGNIVRFEDVLKKYKKTKLIDFWASWCAPCIRQYGFLSFIQDKKREIKYISISIDEDEHSWREAVKKIEKKKTDHYLVLTEEGRNSLLEIIKLNAIPRFVISDWKGHIVFFQASEPEHPDELISQLDLVNAK